MDYCELQGVYCDTLGSRRIADDEIIPDCNGDTIKEYKLEDRQKFYNEVEYVETLYMCPYD